MFNDINNCRTISRCRTSTHTGHEVASAVKRIKSGKAPECDIMLNEVCKAGEHEMVRRLTAIFSQAYREGCVPTEWGQASICRIYKQKGLLLQMRELQMGLHYEPHL